MKRLEILSHTLVRADKETQPTIAYRDSIVDVDDDVAAELLASGRAKSAEKGAKLRDTTKFHEDEADKRAEAAKSPEATLIGLVAAAVAQALAAAGVGAKPAGA